MVPAGGLEPPRLAPTDFESVMSTIPSRRQLFEMFLRCRIVVTYNLKENYFLSICKNGTFIASILVYKYNSLWRCVMRITSSMYYESLYGQSSTKLSNQLFDVNKQIASGLSIQYAKDDISTFTETMRLDNELAALGESKKSAESGYKISNQTDVILNDFEDTMNRMRTLLVQASNGANSDTSLDSIATELRGIEDHFVNLANSSINGKYLFSGSATDTKPISPDGTYQGNDVAMNAFLGSGVQQQYNITGSDLFLGEEVLVKREVTTNVINKNLTDKYPDFTDPSVKGGESLLGPNDTIRDLMGDTDNDIDTVNAKHQFYLRGTQSDGTAFNEQISMRDDESIDELLKRIGDAYGNTPDLDVVNVTMNDYGQIVVQDKIAGSSKLDFHMVGAVDYSGGTAANVTSLDDLDVGENNFDRIMNGTSTAVNQDLYVKEFMVSSIPPADGAATNIEAIVYDRTQFASNGSSLTSSTPQVLKDGNAFATSSTKLSEVADLSQGTDGTLDGTQFTMSGVDINGNAYTAQIDLKSTANGGSTFSLDGGVTNYEIYNVDTPRSAVDADEMTYQQYMDTMNLIVTGNVPASTGSPTDFDDAVYKSNFSGGTYLTHDGLIEFEESGVSDTKASIALYDSNSGDFSKDPSVMTFNANNAITVRDPKTDFFKTIDEMISSVENHSLYPDSTGDDVRNVGIENSIRMMDDLQDHVFRSHSLVGAQSNSLTKSIERTELLEISTITLRSSVVDTDLAEASLELTQLQLSYEAMLSTVGKVSQLSLVNYL